MIISSIFLIFSAILDSIISNYINYQTLMPSILTPLFIIVAIPLIYPYFCKDNNKYLKVVTIAGLIYDFGFTDTLLLNMFIFFLIGNIVVYLNKILSTNPLNNLLQIILSLIIYNILNYGILYILNIHNYDFWYLIDYIKNTIILNILYGWLMYYILGFISDKFKIKRIY